MEVIITVHNDVWSLKIGSILQLKILSNQWIWKHKSTVIIVLPPFTSFFVANIARKSLQKKPLAKIEKQTTTNFSYLLLLYDLLLVSFQNWLILLSRHPILFAYNFPFYITPTLALLPLVFLPCAAGNWKWPPSNEKLNSRKANVNYLLEITFRSFFGKSKFDSLNLGHVQNKWQHYWLTYTFWCYLFQFRLKFKWGTSGREIGWFI